MKKSIIIIGIIVLFSLMIIMAIHFFLYSDPASLLQILCINACSLFMMGLAYFFVPKFGTFYGSIALIFIIILLPLALLGILTEFIGGRHLSILFAFNALSGIAVGICLSDMHKIVKAIAGLILLAVSFYGLITVQNWAEAILINAVFLVILACGLLFPDKSVKA